MTEAPTIRPSGESANATRNPWHVGLTLRGSAVIVLLCGVHSLRRCSTSLFSVSFVESLFSWGESLIEALIVALPTTVAVVWMYNRVPPPSRIRYSMLGLALAVSSALGATAAFVTGSLGGWEGDVTRHPWTDFVGSWPRYALLGALLTGVFVYHRDRERSATELNALQLDRAQLAARFEETRLAVLQAQIEPHFLFNALATIRRLHETEPPAATAMLDNLIRYLAVALPQMRANESTLGREAALAEAYLNMQQVRMGRRLDFAIDIPQELRDAPFPVVMLLTLVENSIKHGISPLPHGGFVHVCAEIDGAQLNVQVADSGRGFAQNSGAGTGLANIRSRLSALYGIRGRLRLAVNRPRGVTVTLSVPFAVPPRSAVWD